MTVADVPTSASPLQQPHSPDSARRRLSWDRAQSRRSTRVLFIAGAVMLTLVVGAAVFAEALTVHPPDRSSGAPFEAPSAEHLLGTDDLGRDLWSQLIFGARVSLAVGLIAAVAATTLGTAAALIAGWHRGWIDAAIMRLVDLTLSLPFLVLVLVLAAYFGRGLDVLIVLIAGVLWARPARLLRGQVLKIREFGHTEAAHSMGAGSVRIMVVHILWRLVPLLVSQFVRAAAVAVIVQSGVAFLGLGDPGRISWGSTLYFANNGSAILTDAWLWWIVPPGVALTILIVGFAFVGYAFEEVADPQLSSHGWRPPTRRHLSETVPDPCPAGVRLAMRSVTVDYDGATAVHQACVQVDRGRVLGLVGESGSGKSTLGLVVPGLVPHPGYVHADAVMLDSVDLRRLGRQGLQKIRGRDIAIVPQAAMSVLDPTMNVLDQVAESASLRPGAVSATERAHDLLDQVGLARNRHRAFPHELSGGQRQRVVIAMAVANRPKLLIADEPTTGLDVINQHAILDLLDELRHQFDFDLWLISHDLPLAASRSDDVAVLYGGRVVESGPSREVVAKPLHPYTAMLVDAFPSLHATAPDLTPLPVAAEDPAQRSAGCVFAPRCPHSQDDCESVTPQSRAVANVTVACHHAPIVAPLAAGPGPDQSRATLPTRRARSQTAPALCIDDAWVRYRGRRREDPDIAALKGVTLSVEAGESVAIIGRSAAGKSTLARLAVGLMTPAAGSVELLGQTTAALSQRQLRQLRRRIQMVFQDPYESLHPGMRVAALAGEPLRINGIRRDEHSERVSDALRQLGLAPAESYLGRHAATLSGGQRQRVALARTLVAEPELIVADEPASMLDASLRATVAAHLLAVRAALGATLIFITHDISLARLVADRMVVIADGRVVEDGPAEQLIAAPTHRETRALIDAARLHHSPLNAPVLDSAPSERSG